MGKGPQHAATGTGTTRREAARPRWDLRDPASRRRAMWHYQLVDHGILRHLWTNAAEVAPGVWRSNQPSARRWAAMAREGLRTVINLRGDGEESFHLFARESCERLGLRLVTVPLRSRRAPERAAVLQLLAAFREAERPLLIHCKSGADRSGFAAALWLLAMEGRPVEEARRQLSWRHWHLARGRAGVLGHVLDLYAARLAQGPIGVEDWVREEYDPEAAQAGFRP